jgi:hypothetical protein
MCRSESTDSSGGEKEVGRIADQLQCKAATVTGGKSAKEGATLEPEDIYAGNADRSSGAELSTEFVYQRLRHAILRGQVRPGPISRCSWRAARDLPDQRVPLRGTG